MTLQQAIEIERDREMEPFRKHGMTPEPCISVPFSGVLVDRKRECVYITLADLAKACSDGESQETKP
jgi:hypothetical protein